jgi:4-diphosphocytidyl-2-C-methyl-D-erythritol kinase
MCFRRDHVKRTTRAPAKLNLYLEILGRRSDGFHELESLLVPIDLADSLAFTATAPPEDGSLGPIGLDVRPCYPVRPPPANEQIPAAGSNLVVQALELLRVRSGCRWGARIELVKRIPAAAGLGGASSDAAAALRLANRAWRIGWPQNRLAELAAEVGSDVPFFLSGQAAICRGRGERVERIAPMPPLYFVVVKPPVALNTAEVYQAHDGLPHAARQPIPANGLTAILAPGRWPAGGHWLHNRLQAAAAVLSPWVQRLQNIFDRLDCVAHQLTGSGSAYFGVCRHAQHARRLASLLRTQQLGFVYATQTHT